MRLIGKEYFAYILATVVAVGLVCVPASKFGAGAHHLMPFLPTLAVGVGTVLSRAGKLEVPELIWKQVLLIMLVSWLACCYTTASEGMRAEWKQAVVQSDPSRAEDMENVIETFGGKYLLLSGAGGDADYAATYFRPILVFAGFPIALDPGALMDRKQGGTKLPALGMLLADVQKEGPSAKPVMWVIPRGSEPFSLHSAYPPGDGLFPPEFRQDFGNAFRSKTATRHFELYTSDFQ